MDSSRPSLSDVSSPDSMDGMSFDDLPYEIKIRIFAHLDTTEIHTLRSASAYVFRITIPITSWSFYSPYSGYCGHAQFTESVYNDIWRSDSPGLHQAWKKMAIEGNWF